jgi:hypothetical protein
LPNPSPSREEKVFHAKAQRREEGVKKHCDTKQNAFEMKTFAPWRLCVIEKVFHAKAQRREEGVMKRWGTK